MKVTLAIATFCVVMACSHAARTTTTTATKPGRFLSLPVPAKCASRKYTYHQTPYPKPIPQWRKVKVTNAARILSGFDCQVCTWNSLAMRRVAVGVTTNVEGIFFFFFCWRSSTCEPALWRPIRLTFFARLFRKQIPFDIVYIIYFFKFIISNVNV